VVCSVEKNSLGDGNPLLHTSNKYATATFAYLTLYLASSFRLIFLFSQRRALPAADVSIASIRLFARAGFRILNVQIFIGYGTGKSITCTVFNNSRGHGRLNVQPIVRRVCFADEFTRILSVPRFADLAGIEIDRDVRFREFKRIFEYGLISKRRYERIVILKRKILFFSSSQFATRTRSIFFRTRNNNNHVVGTNANE